MHPCRAFQKFYPHPVEFSEWEYASSVVAEFSFDGVASTADPDEVEELVAFNLFSLFLLAAFKRRSLKRAAVFCFDSFSSFMEAKLRCSSSCSSAHRVHGLLGNLKLF